MKFGVVSKSLGADNTNDDLTLINKLSRKTLTAEDVYIFPVVMCDNEVDRDLERFTADTLKELADMYVGTTVITDHKPMASNQRARIFATSLETNESVKVENGEPLTKLIARVYMLNNQANEDVIANIEAGVLKEVSVGCNVARAECSICGKEFYGPDCGHIKGKMYGEKLCVVRLQNAKDAYELSFVAVPAQRGAGVTKWYKGTDKKGAEKKVDILDKIKALEIEGMELVETDTDEVAVDKLISAYKEAKEKSAEVKTIEVEVEPSDYKEFKSKATEFDGLKDKAITAALTNGVKAKGDKFDNERWEKLLKNFTYGEVVAQADEWVAEAETELNAGGRKSLQGTDSSIFKDVNLGDYKYSK